MPTPKSTYEDFLKSFNDEELADLTNLHLPDSEQIDRPKIEYLLQRAAADWLSWFGASNYDQTTIPHECIGSAVTCEIAIARRSLDFNNPRESVQQQYEFCYQIARDWKSDQIKLRSSSGDSGSVPGTETVMSIFTI